MVRAVLGAVVVVLAIVPASAAAQSGVRDDLAAVEVALAGPDVFVLRDLRRGSAELVAVPRAGGPSRTLLSVDSAQPSLSVEERLSASDARVAVIVEMLDRRGHTTEWRVYSGPPSGPLDLVRRTPDRGAATWSPAIVDVDGDRLLLVEARERDGAIRAQILAPGLGFVPVAWTSMTVAPVAIAGPYAMKATTEPGSIAVADAVSGADLAVVEAHLGDGEGFDLAADGRMVAAIRAGLATVRPGEPARILPGTRRMRSPRFAGAAVAAVDGDRLPTLVAGDGSRQALGPPSHDMVDLSADDRGVAWIANGCVRYVALAAPAPPPAASDPCPATEIGLYLIADSRLRGRVVRTPVRCVTAPEGVCRGTVLARRGGRIVGRGRFAIAAGRQRWVPIRLNRSAAARFRRERGGSVIIGARIPGGRVGAGRGGASELSIKVGRPGSR